MQSARSAVGAQRRPRKHESPAGTAWRDAQALHLGMEGCPGIAPAATTTTLDSASANSKAKAKANAKVKVNTSEPKRCGSRIARSIMKELKCA